MPINPVPERDGIAYDAMGRTLVPAPAWREWFRSVFYGFFGWKRTYTTTKEHNFVNILAQDEQTVTVALAGVRIGDAVIVRPATARNGIAIDGTVTADDEVTIRAFNYSALTINPANTVYRVIVFQQ